jgi:hypothetical protein
MWRAIACMVKSPGHAPGSIIPYDERSLAPFKHDEQYELLEVITKAAVNPAFTNVAGWASELLATVNSQFVSALAQTSVAGALFSEGGAIDVSVPRGVVKVPTRSATPAVNGSYVGEGQPIPVRRPGLTSITLGPKKLGVISTFSAEIAGHSQPTVESVIRQCILEDTSIAVDAILLGATAADAIAPAGLRAGLAGLTPSTATASYDRMIADLKTLLGAIAPSSRPVILVNNASQALSMQWVAGTPEQVQPGLRAIASASVPANMVIAVDLDALCFTSQAPFFQISRDALVHEEDTTPLPITAGAGPNPAAVANIAAPVRSLWQTDTIAIGYLWALNWALRRANGVAWMTGVTW